MDTRTAWGDGLSQTITLTGRTGAALACASRMAHRCFKGSQLDPVETDARHALQPRSDRRVVLCPSHGGSAEKGGLERLTPSACAVSAVCCQFTGGGTSPNVLGPSGRRPEGQVHLVGSERPTLDPWHQSRKKLNDDNTHMHRHRFDHLRISRMRGTLSLLLSHSRGVCCWSRRQAQNRSDSPAAC